MESQRTRPSRPLLKHALAGLIAAVLVTLMAAVAHGWLMAR